jgi:hypothetical protein
MLTSGSPRWLLWKGRDHEALDIFKTFHSDPNDPEHILAWVDFCPSFIP